MSHHLQGQSATSQKHNITRSNSQSALPARLSLYGAPGVRVARLEEAPGLDGSGESLGLALGLPARLSLDGAPRGGIAGLETTGGLEEGEGLALALPAGFSFDGAPGFGIAGLVEVVAGGFDEGHGGSLALPARLALYRAPWLGFGLGGGITYLERLTFISLA